MKRSSNISLVLIASLAATTSLSGCGSSHPDLPPDNGGTFANMAECVAKYDQQTCATAQHIAYQEHLQNAPHYYTQADCIMQYGAGMCQPASVYGGAGNIWMPMMMGYMMGSATSRPAPLYYGTIYQRQHYVGGGAPIFTSGVGFSHSAPIGAAPFVSNRPAISAKAGFQSTTSLTPAASVRGGFGSNFKPAATFTSNYAASNPTAFGKVSVPATSSVGKSFTSNISNTSTSSRGGFGSVSRGFGGDSGFGGGGHSFGS